MYSLRNRMYESLSPYIKESDKEGLSATLQVRWYLSSVLYHSAYEYGNVAQAVEDWLYDEGEDVTKSVYIAKLDELKKTGGPIEMRYEEDQTRGPAADALRQSAESYLAFAKSDSPTHAHIEVAERQIIIKEAESVLHWLRESLTLGSFRKPTT